MKYIAVCTNLPEKESKDWYDKSYGKKYPGAGWLKHIPPNILLSGQEAKKLVSPYHEELDPKNVCIVQEEDNPDGWYLYAAGCVPSVQFCLESPIYASGFYDGKHDLAWKHRMVFNSASDPAYFPSYDQDDIVDPVPWNDRNLLCMVTANKHYSGLGDRYKDSHSFKLAMETQLHDYRYQAIAHFRGKMDLYGKGWGGFSHECEDKLATIRQYKFSLCFENGSYPGYVTEKIIDCLVAGVIPVYMGAPDIERYVPSELYIDARNFSTFEQMEVELRRLSDIDQTNQILRAQEWLSPRGYGSIYSNEAFAKRIVDMCGLTS